MHANWPDTAHASLHASGTIVLTHKEEAFCCFAVRRFLKLDFSSLYFLKPFFHRMQSTVTKTIGIFSFLLNDKYWFWLM